MDPASWALMCPVSALMTLCQGPQGGGDQGGVGGGTAHDEVDLSLCPAQLFYDLCLGLLTPLVRPIAGVVLLVGLGQGL